jgi:hypothetical protein
VSTACFPVRCSSAATKLRYSPAFNFNTTSLLLRFARASVIYPRQANVMCLNLIQIHERNMSENGGTKSAVDILGA